MTHNMRLLVSGAFPDLYACSHHYEYDQDGVVLNACLDWEEFE